MICNILADDQRTIRSDLEQIQRVMHGILAQMKHLDRTDERVRRSEAALASIERVLWAMTAGPGRLGPAVKIHSILTLPTHLYSVPKEPKCIDHPI